MPNLTVVAPGDPFETRAAIEAIVARGGPAYLRLGRAGEPLVHAAPVPLAIGKAIELRSGADVTLISTGGMLATASRVASLLHADGIEARLLSMHTLKPLDADAVLAAATQTRLVVTIEEHSVIGGLGGAVAEVMAEHTGRIAPLKRIGLPSAFISTAGSRDYLAHGQGLSADSIFASVRRVLTVTQ
jgi:transketolase